MSMSRYATIVDGRTVRFEREFPISVEQLWTYLTSPAGLRTWLADGHIGPDGAELRFENNGSSIQGAVLVWEPPHVVEFAWSGGPTQPAGSRVRFEVSSVGTQSRLLLTHTRVEGDAAPEFAAGWHRHLDTLSAALGERLEGEVRLTWQQLHQQYAQQDIRASKANTVNSPRGAS